MPKALRTGSYIMKTPRATLNVFLGLVTVCSCFHTKDIADGHGQRMKWNSCVSCAQCIDEVLGRLRWTRIALLHDNITDFRLQRKVIAYDITVLGFETTMQDLHKQMFPDLNILVCVSHSNRQLLVSLLHEVDQYDAKRNVSTDFRRHSKWLIMLQEPNLWTSELQIRNLQHVAFFRCMKERIPGQFLSLRHHPGESIFETVSQCTILNISTSCLFLNTRFKYNNIQLRVAVIQSAKYTDKTIVNGTTVYSGFTIDVLHLLQEALNFSSTLVEPSPRSWGVFNGTWDGLVGLLHRREVDLAVADLTETWERSKVVDFLHPSVRQEASVFLYKTPDESDFFLIFRPLRTEIYVALFGGVVVVSAILVLLKTRCHYDYDEALSTSYDVLAIVFKQSTMMRPDDCPRRCVLVSWCLVVLIVTSAYSATLVASLSDQSNKIPFTSIDELLDSDYETACVSGSLYLSQLQNTSQNVFGRIYHKLKVARDANPALKTENFSDLLARVNRGNFALLEYKSIVVDREAKDWQLTHVKDSILVERLAFAVPKGSPMKGDLENILFSLRESGLLEQLWIKQNGQQIPMTNRTNSRKAITIYQMGGGFIAVAVGLVLALMLLLCECIKQWGHQKVH